MFEKFSFSVRQIKKYHQTAIKDLRIAKNTNDADVKFRFSYDALLKLSIAICAKNGLRVKARKGHHIELLRKLSTILKDKDINIIGDEMRSKRNFDLYSGGILISKKEAKEYYKWTENIFKLSDDIMESNLKLL